MRKSTVLLALLSILIASCTGQPAPTAEPTAPPTSVPPTSTAVPAATFTPSPTPDLTLFKDEFESTLDPEWQWIKENNKMWSLESNPGWLEITVGSGRIGEQNLLGFPIPEGDFELETKLKFEPAANYQFAGLTVFYNSANYISFGRAFCSACIDVADGFYMDNIESGNFFVGDNFATPTPGTDTVFLRLRREGSTYTSFYSDDGNTWTKLGTHTNDMDPKFVGLVTGQSTSGSVPAQFDYFIIRSLN
jgi:beta-xylosidase